MEQSSFFYWGPYVERTTIPEHIRKYLLEEGNKVKYNIDFDASKTLAGHLEHQYLYPKDIQKKFYTDIIPILQNYRKGHCMYHGLDNLNVELEPINLWINFMQPGDFNPIHIHNGDYTFVTFLDVPDELTEEIKEWRKNHTSYAPGEIHFDYTTPTRPKWATTARAITPKTGDMIIFPTLLSHWVAPYKSKCTRISVSGNLRIANRENLPNDYF